MPVKSQALLKYFQQNIWDVIQSKTVAEVVPALHHLEDLYQQALTNQGQTPAQPEKPTKPTKPPQGQAASMVRAMEQIFYQNITQILAQTTEAKDADMLHRGFVAVNSQMTHIMDKMPQRPLQAQKLSKAFASAGAYAVHQASSVKGTDHELADLYEMVGQSYQSRAKTIMQMSRAPQKT